MAEKKKYPVVFEIEYKEKMNRLSTFLRMFYAIPAFLVLSLLSAGLESGMGGITSGLFLATLITIVFRQLYPKWWFDFALELNRFSSRVAAYALLLTDRFPSTYDSQAVKLDIEYPNVKKDLNRWMPLVKWFLAIPHYIVLCILFIGVLVGTLVAWFSILFSGSYPKSIFNFVVGVLRWSTRVGAYAFLLTTDEYPPFSLES
jgi:hypothetical protein